MWLNSFPGKNVRNNAEPYHHRTEHMKYKILRWIFLLLMLTLGKVQAQKLAPAATVPTADTIQIKGLIIIKGKDARGKNHYKFYNDTVYARNKLKKNLHTRWLVIDLG